VTAPSGAQLEIVHGDWSATIVEVGGGLRTLSLGGRELLDGYAEHEMCKSGRGQLLVPWPNRLRDGKYDDKQVPLNEPETHNAIHGLVRWTSWRAAARTQSAVTMAHTLHPQPGYPFSLDLGVTYRLADDGLTVELHATNVGDGSAPFGAGQHPYVRVAERVDDVTLQSPGAIRLETDERHIPVRAVAVDGEYDFREPRRIGDTVLDACYGELGPSPRVHLTAPDGLRVTVWLGEPYRWVMLFSGDPLPDVARRSLAVEPMTCPPNALQTGEDVIHLAPGDSLTARWGIQAE
jgi:aldose 1-epimerase